MILEPRKTIVPAMAGIDRTSWFQPFCALHRMRPYREAFRKAPKVFRENYLEDALRILTWDLHNQAALEMVGPSIITPDTMPSLMREVYGDPQRGTAAMERGDAEFNALWLWDALRNEVVEAVHMDERQAASAMSLGLKLFPFTGPIGNHASQGGLAVHLPYSLGATFDTGESIDVAWVMPAGKLVNVVLLQTPGPWQLPYRSLQMAYRRDHDQAELMLAKTSINRSRPSGVHGPDAASRQESLLEDERRRIEQIEHVRQFLPDIFSLIRYAMVHEHRMELDLGMTAPTGFEALVASLPRYADMDELQALIADRPSDMERLALNGWRHVCVLRDR